MRTLSMALLSLMCLSSFLCLSAQDYDVSHWFRGPSQKRRVWWKTSDLKVAVCAVGHLRSFVLPGICKSWLTNLLSGVKAHIYLVAHSGFFQGNNNKVSHFNETSYNRRLACLRAHVAVDATLCSGSCSDLEAAWRAEGLTDRKCRDSSNFKQVMWLDHCIRKVRNSGHDYDLFVRIRPDVGVFEPMPWNHIRNNCLNYMNKDCSGETDWFFVMGASLLKTWWGPVVRRYLEGDDRQPDYVLLERRPDIIFNYVEFPIVLLRTPTSCYQKGQRPRNGCIVGVHDSQCFRHVGKLAHTHCPYPRPVHPAHVKMMGPYYASCMALAFTDYWYSGSNETAIDADHSFTPITTTIATTTIASYRTADSIPSTITKTSSTTTVSAVDSRTSRVYVSNGQEAGVTSEEVRLRVAVCSVGDLHSFSLPMICRSLLENLLSSVDADLYLVALTASSNGNVVNLPHFDFKLPANVTDCLPDAPVYVKVCRGECVDLAAAWKADGRYDRRSYSALQCLGRDSFFMRIMWLDHCIHQVRHSGKHYDLLVRTRPDVGLFAPLPWRSIDKSRLNYMNKDCNARADFFFVVGLRLLDVWWDEVVQLYLSSKFEMMPEYTIFNRPDAQRHVEFPVVVLHGASCKGQRGCHIGVDDAQCFRLVGAKLHHLCPYPDPLPEYLTSSLSPYYAACMDKAKSGYWYGNSTSNTTIGEKTISSGRIMDYKDGSDAPILYGNAVLMLPIGICFGVCLFLARRSRCLPVSEVADVEHGPGVARTIGNAQQSQLSCEPETFRKDKSMGISADVQSLACKRQEDIPGRGHQNTRTGDDTGSFSLDDESVRAELCIVREELENESRCETIRTEDDFIRLLHSEFAGLADIPLPQRGKEQFKHMREIANRHSVPLHIFNLARKQLEGSNVVDTRDMAPFTCGACYEDFETWQAHCSFCGGTNICNNRKCVCGNLGLCGNCEISSDEYDGDSDSAP